MSDVHSKRISVFGVSFIFLDRRIRFRWTEFRKFYILKPNLYRQINKIGERKKKKKEKQNIQWIFGNLAGLVS